MQEFAVNMSRAEHRGLLIASSRGEGHFTFEMRRLAVSHSPKYLKAVHHMASLNHSNGQDTAFCTQSVDSHFSKSSTSSPSTPSHAVMV